MTKEEISRIVWEAIILLQDSQPGVGTAIKRETRRKLAYEKLQSLPDYWWQHLSLEEAERVAAALILLT